MTRTTSFSYRAYNPRWLLAMLAIFAIASAAATVPVALEAGAAPAIALAAGALLTAALGYGLRWFEVTLDETGLRYGWAGFRPSFIPHAEIASVEIRKYPWIFGYGWRWAGRTVCYSIPFERQALAVTRTHGFVRRYYFTLAAAEEARAALAGLPGIRFA